MREIDLTLPDGRRLHAYDTGGTDLPVFWQHGTPNLGTPPEPLFEAADRLGIRWVSHNRPAYGNSTRKPGRSVGDVAADIAHVADELGIERFGVMGHSGGGTHAVACAAQLPDRVLAAVDCSGLAPFGADGLDWFGGMGSVGIRSLRAATQGVEAKTAYEASPEAEAMPDFTDADFAALEGRWGWLGKIAGAAIQGGPDGLIDDDLSAVTPWGCDPATIAVPLLVVHGEDDRVVPVGHGVWLAEHCPGAEFWSRPGDGHISVLAAAEPALTWLRDHAGR